MDITIREDARELRWTIRVSCQVCRQAAEVYLPYYDLDRMPKHELLDEFTCEIRTMMSQLQVMGCTHAQRFLEK